MYGTYIFEDIDGNEKITDAADRKILSYQDPSYRFSVQNVFRYKSWELKVFINSIQGGKKWYRAQSTNNSILTSTSVDYNLWDFDYWTPENTGAKYPKPGGKTTNDNPVYGSTLGYFNAGYLKVRAITLGYTFDDFKFVKDLGISRLRLYATVQNPFVLFSPFTNECGLDPETNTYANNGANMAVTMGEYSGKHRLPVIGYNTPSTRNFILGLNVTF